MALVDPLKKYIGQGEIYDLGATTPASMTRLRVLTDGRPSLDGSAPVPGMVYVGLTNGVATVEYKPEYSAVEIEQTYGEVAPRVTKESVSLKFKAASATAANVALSLATATASTGAAPASTTYFVGGKAFGASHCMALTSPLKNPADGTTQYWEWVCIYSAYATNGLSLGYKRGETRMIEIEMIGYADPDRTEGDQLFQIGQVTGA